MIIPEGTDLGGKPTLLLVCLYKLQPTKSDYYKATVYLSLTSNLKSCVGYTPTHSNAREQPEANAPPIPYRENLSRKRQHTYSPTNSPLKQTRSPAPKIRRRLRTGNEHYSKTEREPVRGTETSLKVNESNTKAPLNTKTLSDFRV